MTAPLTGPLFPSTAAWPADRYDVHERKETDPATQADIWLWVVLMGEEFVDEFQEPGPAYRLAARLNRERRLRSA